MQKFIITQKNNIWFGSFPMFSEAGFLNACSCRLHGVSNIHDNLFNLALHVGDEKKLVIENRKRLAAALGIEAKRFTTCEQIHGGKVAVVDEILVGAGAETLETTIADTDALITQLSEVPLLLFYADCVPVLLADKVTGAIGLVHAGWRGTVGGIVRKALQAMQINFGSKMENMLAAVGPSIGGCCYEVDDYVRSQANGYDEFFKPSINNGSGKYMLDLWGFNKKQLLQEGVPEQQIAVAEICTAHNKELFCSYRAEYGKTGRMGVCLCSIK